MPPPIPLTESSSCSVVLGEPVAVRHQVGEERLDRVAGAAAPESRPARSAPRTSADEVANERRVEHVLVAVARVHRAGETTGE